MANLLKAIGELYKVGLAVWDLRPESIMLHIGQETKDAGKAN